MNFLNNKYIRRRWLDFRNGHSIYLIFLMTFANFIVIQYRLLIDRMPSIDSLTGGNIIGFAMTFIAIYVPLAIIIGYWHRRNQYAVENEAMTQENWIMAWLGIYQIRLIQGKTRPIEDEAVLNYLNSILIRTKKDDLLKLSSQDRDPLK
jgi:hypothetical protein